MFRDTKAFTSFSVHNLQPAKQFYAETLGLEVIDNPMGVIELQIEGSNNILVYPKPDHTPAKFTILNFPVSNIDEAVDNLASLGVTFEQYEGDIQTNEKGICRNPDGPALAWFKDPAGNILSIIQQ